MLLIIFYKESTIQFTKLLQVCVLGISIKTIKGIYGEGKIITWLKRETMIQLYE